MGHWSKMMCRNNINRILNDYINFRSNVANMKLKNKNQWTKIKLLLNAEWTINFFLIIIIWLCFWYSVSAWARASLMEWECMHMVLIVMMMMMIMMTENTVCCSVHQLEINFNLLKCIRIHFKCIHCPKIMYTWCTEVEEWMKNNKQQHAKEIEKKWTQQQQWQRQRHFWWDWKIEFN